jgi:predicted transcriptional regulator
LVVETTTVSETLRIAAAEGSTEGIALDDEALDRVVSPTSLALLRAIVAEEPGSIRATAAAVDRDVKNVHENLMELSRLGVVEFEWDGNARKPRVPYDELAVSVPLPEGPAEGG